MDHDEFLDDPAASPHDAFLDAPPDEGALMAAGRGALRNVPLAQQAVAAIEPGKYSENLKSLVSGAEAAKSAHPVAYGTGAVAGTLAPLALGQPEGLAANIGLNAGLGAAQAVSDTDLSNQKAQAAKQALAGGAIGGGMAGILGKLGEYFAQKAAPAVAEAATPATSRALETVNPTGQEIAPVVNMKPNSWDGLEELYPAGHLEPPHEVDSPQKVADIKKSIEENGWQGRPLLAIPSGDGWQLLTGTHRVNAASEIDPELQIPVVKIPDSEYTEEEWKELQGLKDDEDMLRFFSENGPRYAEDLTRSELDANAEEELANLTQIGGRAIPNKPVAQNFQPTAARINASMTAQGLGGTPRQQMKYILGKDPVKSLNDISKWMSEADDGKSLIGLMDRPGELLPKVQSVHHSAGNEIGNIIERVAPGAKVDSEGLSEKLNSMLPGTYNSKAASAIRKVARQIRGNAIVDEEGNVTGYQGVDFKQLQKIKSEFGKEAGERDAHYAVKDAYGEIAQHMNDAVDAAQAQVNDPAMLAKYLKAKFDYQTTSHLLPILIYQEAKELIGGPAGHFSLRGLLGTLVGSAVGAPVQVARNALLKSAPAAGRAAEIAAPVAKAAGKGLSKIPQAAQIELANALESKYGKKEDGY